MVAVPFAAAAIPPHCHPWSLSSLKGRARWFCSARGSRARERLQNSVVQPRAPQGALAPCGRAALCPHWGRHFAAPRKPTSYAVWVPVPCTNPVSLLVSPRIFWYELEQCFLRTHPHEARTMKNRGMHLTHEGTTCCSLRYDRGLPDDIDGSGTAVFFGDAACRQLNHRLSASRGEFFHRLAQQAVQIAAQPYAVVTKPQPVMVACVKCIPLMKNEDRWLSIDELAAYLGVKPDTVYTWIGKKGLPAHKMGRLWKMKRSEVDAWVRSGKAASEGTK